MILLAVVAAGSCTERVLVAREHRRDAGGADRADAADAEPDIEVCSPQGWCYELPRPADDDLYDLFCLPAGTCWLAGWAGFTARWEGERWTTAWTPTTGRLLGIWGSDADAIWAVGDDGPFRWDGVRWLDPASDAESFIAAGVWGSRRDDVWAVGQQAWHFDGVRWSATALPDGYSASAVWGAAPERYWATGRGPDGHAALLRLEGGSWVPQDLAWQPCELSTAPPLIAGVSADDCWIGGCQTTHATLLHWNGNAWQSQGLPVDGGLVHDLWVRADGELLVLGPAALWSGGVDGFSLQRPFWSDVTLIAGTAAGEIWAAGQGLHHFDGVRWIDSHPRRDTFNELRGVWGASAADAWVVGEDVVLRRDGREWITSTGAGELWDVHGRASDDVWIAGDGIALHWDGAALTEHALGSGERLSGIWTAADGQAFACGNSGGLYVYPPSAESRWRSVPGPAGIIRLIDVWGASPGAADQRPDLLWVLDDSGALYGCALDPAGECQGSWAREAATGSDSLRCLWGDGFDETWTAGEAGALWSWRRTQGWTRQPAPAAHRVDAGAGGIALGHIWLLTNGGGVLHHDGTAWREEALPTRRMLTAIWAWPDRAVAVGFRANVLSREVAPLVR